MNSSEWYPDSVEHSTAISKGTDSNSNNGYWSATPYFLEILIPIISSFLLLRRRDLLERLLLNLDKNCFSALCPSLSKREHLLKWAQRGIMPSWMPCPMNISLTLDDVWKDGSLLCTLINSAIPGACPNPHRHRNKPPNHGQALAYKYFGLAPMFTNEDFDQDLTGNLEFIFFMYLTQLRTNISRFSNSEPFDVKYTSSYIARGMGLVTGEQYKKCVFYLYPNLSENDTGVLVTIKGPYQAYGCITLPPFYIFKTSSGKNRRKKVFYVEEDMRKLTVVKTPSEKHLFRTITSSILPFLRNPQSKPATSKIPIEANKEPDRIKLTYVPQHPGVHIMCIITDGCHLQGSPFNVSVSESNVEEIQEETAVAKTEFGDKSKPLNQIRWMKTIAIPLSSNRYFNKSTCGPNEPNLFEKYNRINYNKFCKKFELFRSSFDERQEFSLDSVEDNGFFNNNEVRFLKRNSRAFERFTDSIQKVMRMGKHEEVKRIQGRIMTKAICDKTNTFSDQQEDTENRKIRYFEEKDATKQLGESEIIKKSNIVLKRNQITGFILTDPKQTRKQQTDDIISKEIIKSNKSSLGNVAKDKLVKLNRIPGVKDSDPKYNIKIAELPDVSEDIDSQEDNFNKIFKDQDSKEKKLLSIISTKMYKAKNNSFCKKFEDGENATARSEKTITSESNNTFFNFSAECEVDKTKNAITEQSSVMAYSPKEILEDKNMFTNEKIIKNIADKNSILLLKEFNNGKTSEAKRIFEGNRFNFTKSQHQPSAVENFKGIDIWENRTDGGRIHEKDEKINSVKMKIFTYDNSVNTRQENKLQIDHNKVNKSQKFNLVEKQKKIFDGKYEKENDSQKLNVQYVSETPLISVNSLRNRFDSNQKEPINIPPDNEMKKPESNTYHDDKEIISLSCVSGENLAHNFISYSPFLETSTGHEELYTDDNNSVLINSNNLRKETEERRATEAKNVEPTLTPITKDFITIQEKLSENETDEYVSTILTEINQKSVSNYRKFESELLPLKWSESIQRSEVGTKLGDRPINSSNHNVNLLLDKVNSLIDKVEQEEEVHEYSKEATLLNDANATDKLGQSLDNLLYKVDNLIDNIKREEKSAANDDYDKPMNLNSNLDFVDSIIDVPEEKEKQVIISEAIGFSSGTNESKAAKKDTEYLQNNAVGIYEEDIMPTNYINVEINDKPENSEIEVPCRYSSVLMMKQRFESPFASATEKEEFFRRTTESTSALYKSTPYLERQGKFKELKNTSGKGQNCQQGTVTEEEGLSLSAATKSYKATAKSEPSKPSPQTFLKRRRFFSEKSQSYPAYDDIPNEVLNLTHKRNSIATPTKNDSENAINLLGNLDNNKTSTIYIVTERNETEMRKKLYTRSFSSPTKEILQEIHEPPVKENTVTTECDILNDKKHFETNDQPVSFSSIIKKTHSTDDEMFPDVSGFLKENNRQYPNVDYPKDFSVSRRVSRIESLQSLLAQNNMYVTSQIHRSHPNIYFGESPKRKRTHKPWRKLKSFDANLLTACSESQNDTKTSRYNVDNDICSDNIKETVPPAACNEVAIEGKHPSRIIKYSGTQQAERRSQETVSNCQINQEGLRDGTQYNSQSSHLDSFPSVKDLRSKFEKNAESIENSKIRGKTRLLHPEKCSSLDSSEENSTTLKYFTPTINSTYPPNDQNRETNKIKPLKQANYIFSSIEINVNKNQPELTLTQGGDGVKENPLPHVLKSTSQHHFNGGCKHGTTSSPQYSFIKTPEATNSIRSDKKTRQVVQYDKGKTPEKGDDASCCEKEEFETIDAKNILKNQFIKARNFFKELEKNRQLHKVVNRSIKKKRKNSNGSGRLPKVSEKFPVENIYKDVLGDKNGSFKGAANRVGVANAMASVPVRHNFFEPDSIEALPTLDIFRRGEKRKPRKSLKSIFLVDY